ncbi:MAG: Rieske 2Fe-2S domain-containing protein, partial [Candidatus Brocadiaceae bacterium]
MSEQKWTPVAERGELEDGVPLGVKVGKRDVLLVRVGDEIHACGGKCTHYGAPLVQGVLRGHVVTCPWHSARFDVRTGEAVSPPALDATGCFPVKIEHGHVYVGEPSEPKPPKIEGQDDRVFAIVGAGGAGNAA